MPRQQEKKYEYINTTEAITIWIDESTDYSKKPKPKSVNPGESVFFTSSDLLRNKRQSKELFAKGLLRPAGVDDKSKLVQIDVRDDMSKMEMEEFVKKTMDIKTFGSKLRKLNSINTLENILQFCKSKNKTYNFIETVNRRINKIQESEEG